MGGSYKAILGGLLFLCFFSLAAGASEFAVVSERWADVYSKPGEDEQARIAQALYAEPILVQATQGEWSRVSLL